MVINTSSGSCDSSAACPNGPVTWVIQPFASGGFPPAPFDPGYKVQPCDSVTWSFGDGTTQTVAGSDRVTHDYPLPGNYTVSATVTNALGSGTALFRGPAVIATSPSRLSFVTQDSFIPPAGGAPGWSCIGCVVAHEGSGAVTIGVTRSLDLSRTISADAVMNVDGATIRVPLTFAANETQKSFTVPIADDQVYSGRRFSPLRFESVAGGALTIMNTSWQPGLAILDDDPVPTLSIDPAIAVAEGDSGPTLVSIPVHLTAPMGVDIYGLSFFYAGSATWEDFVAGYGPSIPAGQTSGFVTALIRGNTRPEPDKTFSVRIAPASTNADPLFGATTCVVTILNDDAALLPAQNSATTGTPVRLTLDIGSPLRAAGIVAFTSSAPDVVPAPAPVAITRGVTKVSVLVMPRAAGSARISAVVPERTTQPATFEVTAAVRRRAAGH